MALSPEEQQALKDIFNYWAKSDKPLVQLGTGDPTRPSTRTTAQVEPEKTQTKLPRS